MPRNREEEAVKQVILEAGTWELGIYKFASDKEANNKFFMERIFKHAAAKAMVFKTLGQIAMWYKPDAIWGVPSGGQEFAEQIGRNRRLPVIKLEKVPGRRKLFRYLSEDDAKLAASARRLVGVEDITTELTSVKGALELRDLGHKTEAIAAAWRRGTPENEQSVGMPVEWLVEESVPNIITPDHPFFKRYGHLAVQQQVS